MKKILMTFILLFSGFLFVSCNSAEEIPTGDNVGSFSSYEQLEGYLSDFLENQDSNNYLYRDSLTGSLESSVATDSGVNFDSDSKRDYSTTNNQVDGVEEADTILTDGYYIYIASGSEFFMIDAETLDIVYTYEMEEGYLSGLYVYQDKVVLLANVYSYTILSIPETDDTITSGAFDPDADDETGEKSTSSADYSVIIDRYRYTFGTKVVVLDISDTEEIDVFRELYYDSTYLASSRMIDGHLYLVMNNHLYYYDEDGFIPKYMDSVVGTELMNLPANRIYFMPNDGENFSYLILSSFDVTDDLEASVKAYLGSTYQIYMSENNLYTTVYKYTYDEIEGTYDNQTFILRFELENNQLAYKAIGEISGAPLNQFSMDEYEGVFRIAVTDYEYSSKGFVITNTMFLLDATTDDEMTEISVLGGLGKPGERIYSVRYSGVNAYVVTFVNTDPLYKLDLSDPENPEILGELFEEGVSDYLHEITDSLMVGVGRQAVTDGEWTRFVGVKVALYDTTGDEVENIETYLVEGEYSYTSVTYNHKSFMYFTPEDADYTYIAIPISVYYQGYSRYSQQMYVFKITHDGDLELLAQLEHFSDTDSYFDSIEKAVMIENYVYTLSYSQIQVFDMNDNFEFVDNVVFNQTYYQDYYYTEEPITFNTEDTTDSE